MLKKRKVLFIIPSMRGGGSERVVSTLLMNLDYSKFDLTLLLIKKEGKYLDELPSYIRIIDLKSSKVRKSVIKLYKAIYQLNPDVVLTTLGHLNLLVGLLIPFLPKGIKFLARESNTISSQHKTEKYPFLHDFLYKMVMNNYNRIICQSEYMANDINKNYLQGTNKITIINNPVDVEKINLMAQTDEKLFENDKVNLLAVGRFSHVKGFDLLIECMSKLPMDFHLTIIGEGTDENFLKEIVISKGLKEKIRFIDFQKNVFKFMKQANFLVSSSRYEGFPNVILEANACGTPAIAFDCPGGTGEVIEHGVNGMLVECGNTDLLAKSIIIANKMEWKPEVIRHRIVEKYSVVRIIKEYEKLLQ